MSIPSASHSSTRATARESRKSPWRRARAAQTTQRWFGVWIPPTIRASPAFRANRSRSETAWAGTAGGVRRITESDTHTGSSAKAVSGGEWKLVVCRSTVPSACWSERSARAARASRAPISGDPWNRDPGDARAATKAGTRPAVPPAEWMPCSSRTAPSQGCAASVSCRARSAGIRASFASTSLARTEDPEGPAGSAPDRGPLPASPAPPAPAPITPRKRRRLMEAPRRDRILRRAW